MIPSLLYNVNINFNLSLTFFIVISSNSICTFEDCQLSNEIQIILCDVVISKNFIIIILWYYVLVMTRQSISI